MKAYEIKTTGFPPIVCAAASASQAKSSTFSSLKEVGYARNWKHAITQLEHCRRYPSLDEWAQQFTEVTSRDLRETVERLREVVRTPKETE